MQIYASPKEKQLFSEKNIDFTGYLEYDNIGMAYSIKSVRFNHFWALFSSTGARAEPYHPIRVKNFLQEE